MYALWRTLKVHISRRLVSEWESQYATLRLTLKEVARRDEEPVVMSFERMTECKHV